MRKTRIVNGGSKFIGTEEEFNRYVGPYLRNYVQKSISPKYKKEVGRCEECGTVEKLEAAHIHGRGRQKLMTEVLSEYKIEDDTYEFVMHEFADKFFEKHLPFSEVFKVLCHDCHKNYDATLKKSKE